MHCCGCCSAEQYWKLDCTGEISIEINGLLGTWWGTVRKVWGQFEQRGRTTRNNFLFMCYPCIALVSQEPWKRNSCVCGHVAEVCMPGLNQECLRLRWEGVHKISVTFITVNILSGVVTVLLGFFFYCGVPIHVSGDGVTRKALGVG